MIPQRTGTPLGRMLSLIEMPSVSLRFLILDCPTESTLPFYLEEFKRYNVTHVVRCCQPTYTATRLNEQGIQVHDLPFKDGGVVSLDRTNKNQRKNTKTNNSHLLMWSLNGYLSWI